MIIDNYSRYQKKQGKKHAYILEKCSGHYDLLHRPGKRSPLEIPLYISIVPDAVHSHCKRRPALSMSGAGGVYYSGLYIPDVNKPEMAYGDIGEDSLLCIRGEEQAEIFVCKGKKALSFQIFCMLSDHDADLLAEMEDHRQRSIKCIN